MSEPEMKKCAIPDCPVWFVPSPPWQQYHSPKCKNRSNVLRKHKCADDTCARLVSKDAIFCTSHAAQHRAKAGEHSEWAPRRREREHRPCPEGIALHVLPAEYATLEDWLLSIFAKFNTDAQEFAGWIGVSAAAVYRWLNETDKPLTPASQRKLSEATGASLEEIEALRPSKAAWKAQHAKTGVTTRQRYGEEFMSGRGRRGRATAMVRYTDEERSAFSRPGGQANAARTKGKRRSRATCQAIREGKIGKSGRGRPERRAAIGQTAKESQTQESLARQVATFHKTLSDPEKRARWRAKRRLASYKRRLKQLTSGGWAPLIPIIRQLHGAGWKPHAIAKELNRLIALNRAGAPDLWDAIECAGGELLASQVVDHVNEGTLKRVMGDVGLRDLPTGYVTKVEAEEFLLSQRAEGLNRGQKIGAAARKADADRDRQDRCWPVFERYRSRGLDPKARNVWRTIVIECQRDPKTVRRAYDEWLLSTSEGRPVSF